MQIRQCVYEVAQTNHGEVLIAECVSSRKAVAIYFLDNDFDLQMEELQETYPTVQFESGNPTQTALVNIIPASKTIYYSCQVVRAINDLDCSLEVKMVQKANTPFAAQVYNAVQKIPKGETRSYSDIAREIGNPSATRAVAGACARNNLAYIVPCHRVIGSSGNLSGYRWGIAKKRTLLQAEGAELRFSAM
ncbi:Protein CBR-AGT-1 [Caenorhabditis briggsae]|uniref:Methylated-DNA--protein-cysteine methyltransferase n=1 Tax=Caenorhabditis briggsae TaxID=6238 RepID=A8WQU4_CAEBR|nr:Protein CBR-AGT-1 [Caenorhabditis briggsae]CAP22852.2 Protein CBR-AGT-1 [Caenorhabditis briggsae]